MTLARPRSELVVTPLGNRRVTGQQSLSKLTTLTRPSPSSSSAASNSTSRKPKRPSAGWHNSAIPMETNSWFTNGSLPEELKQMIKEIAFTGSSVTDIKRARTFYEHVLGLKPAEEMAGGKW